MAEQQKGTAEEARDRAVGQVIDTLTYILVVALVSAAITKRDAITRLWMRLRHRPVSPEEARMRREVAGLRMDLTRIEHPETAVPRVKGLYEQ